MRRLVALSSQLLHVFPDRRDIVSNATPRHPSSSPVSCRSAVNPAWTIASGRSGRLFKRALWCGLLPRRRIARAASAFLMTRPDFAALTLRFDVMLVAAPRPPHHLTGAWRSDD